MHVFEEEVLRRRLVAVRANMKAKGIATLEESKEKAIEATEKIEGAGEKVEAAQTSADSAERQVTAPETPAASSSSQVQPPVL